MRSIDEIMADMQEIMSQATLTQEDVNTYLALEAELAAAQAAADPTPAEGDGEAAPEPVPANEPATARTGGAPVAAVNALRARHAVYNTVVIPAGRPSPSAGTRQDRIDNAFRSYLRTGRENADLQELRPPQNAQTTGTGSSGGFLVPEGFLNRIVEVVKSFGGVFNDAEQLSTESGNALPFPTNNDTANEAVVATEGAAPGSGADAVFGQVQLGAFEYAASGTGGSALALPIALTQDSAIDIEAFISRILGRRIARKMATDAVSGNGTGQAQGILQGITGREMAGTTLAYDDLVDLVAGNSTTDGLDPYYWTGAKWYMNAASFGTIMKLEDGASQLIFRPGLIMIGEGNATAISGQIQVGPVLAPVVIDPAFSDITGTAGAAINWAVFGNLMEGYIWRQVRQIEVLVNPYTSANKRQIEYNAWVRADGRQQNTSAYAVAAGHTA